MHVEGEAYRNLYLRLLHSHVPGKLDTNKSVIVRSVSDSCDTYYAGNAGPKSSLTPDKYTSLIKELKSHLSSAKKLYVTDAAIGSHRNSEVKFRAVTESPTVALFLRHTSIKLPTLSENPFDYKYTITAYIAPKLNFDNAAYGLKSSFSIINYETNTLIIGGSRSTSALQTGLITLAAPKIFAAGYLPLPSHSLINAKGKTVLVFDPANLLIKLPYQLNGAHHHFWSVDGVTRAWSGVSLAEAGNLKLNRGDLIEKFSNSQKITVSLKSTSNFSSHPAAIVFLNPNSDATIGKINSKEAANMLLYGSKISEGTPFTTFFGSYIPTETPQAIGDKFTSLIDNSKATVYAFGIPKDNQPGNLVDIFKQIISA